MVNKPECEKLSFIFIDVECSNHTRIIFIRIDY